MEEFDIGISKTSSISEVMSKRAKFRSVNNENDLTILLIEAIDEAKFAERSLTPYSMARANGVGIKEYQTKLNKYLRDDYIDTVILDELLDNGFRRIYDSKLVTSYLEMMTQKVEEVDLIEIEDLSTKKKLMEAQLEASFK
jgi:hypothetical protein